MSKLVIAVGTTNPSKLEAVKLAIARIFPDAETEILPFGANSGVSNQPMSDDETILGATNRARQALENIKDAKFGIGIEGGLQLISGRWYECSWVVVLDSSGKSGIGSSARFELSHKLMEDILKGEELATVIDRVSGQTDVRSSIGAMGIVTNGILGRTETALHGIIFAFAPFISDNKYWD